MKKMSVLLSALLAGQQIVVPACAVFAQSDEGDIAPQFQQEPAPAVSASDSGVISPNETEVVLPKATTPGTPLDSVQIGGKISTPLYEQAEAVSPLETRISVRVNNVPLPTFLDSISSQAHVNFLLNEGLENKRITAYLHQVTVREALQILLQIKGLTYQRIGRSSTYVVAARSKEAPNLITKIYTLNYISLIAGQSTASAMNAISSQDVTSRATSNMTTDSSSGTDSSGGGSIVGAGGGDSGVSILSVLQSVLSRNGRLAVEPRTNSLIVTDMAEVFPQVEQILSELDRKAPQVQIEAQIVEINLDRLNELGIEWGGSRGEMATFTGPSRATDYLVRPGFFSGDSWKNFFGDPTTANGAITPGSLSLSQLQATLRALVSRAEARYLGRPKVVTINNKSAIITITKDAAVGLSSVSNSGTSSSTTNTSVERRRIGVTLIVTPQVNKEGYITLNVQPSYSDVQSSAITITGQSTVYDPVSRGVSTLVRVKNGQTIVLGGLLQTTESKTVRKVPLLGYIPIVGWFFTSVSQENKKTDLVLFLTPTLLID